MSNKIFMFPEILYESASEAKEFCAKIPKT